MGVCCSCKVASFWYYRLFATLEEVSCWCGENCEVFKATDRALKSEILMFVSEKMQNNAEMSQCPIVTCSGQRLPTLDYSLLGVSTRTMNTIELCGITAFLGIFLRQTTIKSHETRASYRLSNEAGFCFRFVLGVKDF